MNHAQKYLAQANRQIAELAVQIARQRAIVRHALDRGQRSEMGDSLLDALEASLRLFEKHRIFLLSCSAANNGQQGKSPGSEAVRAEKRRHQVFMTKLDDGSATRSLPLTTIAKPMNRRRPTQRHIKSRKGSCAARDYKRPKLLCHGLPVSTARPTSATFRSTL
jgi:hypothetical protein